MDQSKPIPARTIVLDTARLLKQDKITKEELAKMDKTFRDEVIAYAEHMSIETPLTEIKIKPKADLLGGYTPTRPKDPVIEVKKTVPPPPPTPKVHVAPPPPPIKPTPKPEPKVEPIIVPKVEPKVEVKSEPVIKVEPIITPKAEEKKPETSSVLTLDEQRLYALQEELLQKKAIVAGSLREFQIERNALLHELETIRTKEKEVESDEKHIKNEEKGVSSAEVKVLEEKRWTLEDKRQLLEKDRWEIHKKIDIVDQKVSEKYKEQSAIEEVEESTKKELAHILIKKEAKRAAEDKVNEEKIYSSIQLKKRKYEVEWIKIKENIKHIKDQVAKTDTEAYDIKRQIEALETLEHATTNEKEKHEVEEKRWALEKRLREIEKTVWQLDTDHEEKLKEIESIEKVFASIQLEEESSKEKLNRYNLLIKKAE